MLAAQEIFDTWYNSLDAIDREIYDKTTFTDDDDYPLAITGALSAAAKERGGYFELEKGHWTLAYVPGPPDAYFEARKQEEEAQYAQKQAASEATYQAHNAERQRMKAWTRQLERQGYVCTSLFVQFEKDGAYQGEEHIFETGHFGGNNRFFLETFAGQPVRYESYGNASHCWMPAALAGKLYQQKWEAECADDPGKAAFYALQRISEGLDCYGDDFYTWIRDHIGIVHLVQSARDHAPIFYEQGSPERALVSKFYRIPLKQKQWLGEELVVGYGNTRQWKRETHQSQEQWESYLRTEAWVPFGEEDNPTYHWPTEEDVHAQQEMSRKTAQLFDF